MPDEDIQTAVSKKGTPQKTPKEAKSSPLNPVELEMAVKGLRRFSAPSASAKPKMEACFFFFCSIISYLVPGLWLDVYLKVCAVSICLVSFMWHV